MPCTLTRLHKAHQPGIILVGHLISNTKAGPRTCIHVPSRQLHFHSHVADSKMCRKVLQMTDDPPGSKNISHAVPLIPRVEDGAHSRGLCNLDMILNRGSHHDGFPRQFDMHHIQGHPKDAAMRRTTPRQPSSSIRADDFVDEVRDANGLALGHQSHLLLGGAADGDADAVSPNVGQEICRSRRGHAGLLVSGLVQGEEELDIGRRRPLHTKAAEECLDPPGFQISLIGGGSIGGTKPRNLLQDGAVVVYQLSLFEPGETWVALVNRGYSAFQRVGVVK